MSATLALAPKSPPHEHRAHGFAYWMHRVLEECDRAIPDLAADPVHDLRVALRRCRSMADGFRTMDPDPAWRRMKKAGGVVFKALGDLRDVQVMREWITRLHPETDALGRVLDQSLVERELALQQEALVTLRRFDHEEWRKWAAHLARHASRVRLGGPVFQYLALERLTEARQLHRLALHNRSRTSWHQLRIGIKRFRYTVENFLPQQHEVWSGDLKGLQDALGDVHDLDVLQDLIRSYGCADAAMAQHWHESILVERTKRLENYRKRMVGPESLWYVWRGQLPAGTEQARALQAKLEMLAGFSHGKLAETRRVSALARRLYEELARAGAVRPAGAGLQPLLQAASALLDIGRHNRDARNLKSSARMAEALPVPLGWEEDDWRLVVAAIRYHSGPLPEAHQRRFRRVPASRRRQLFLLAGILRLAKLLVSENKVGVRAERTTETVQLFIDRADQRVNATDLALARQLLETACAVPVLVRFLTGEVRERRPRAIARVRVISRAK